MRKILNYKNKYEFLIIYLCLLFFSGYYFFEYWTMPAILLITMLLLSKVSKTKYSKKILYITLFLIALKIVSELFSIILYQEIKLEIKQLFLGIIIIIMAYLLVNTININVFRKTFVICMIVISIVSIIGFILLQCFPNIVYQLPVLTNSSGRKGYFAFFTIISDFSNTGSHRNQGIFWEPGAFQLFLGLAYIFEIMINKEKPRKWVLALFIITIFTTMSTTGFIVGALLLIYTLCRGKSATTIFRASFVIFVAIVVASLILPQLSGFLKYTLVDKILMVFEYESGISTDASSRVDSIVYPLKEFLKSPLFGIGDLGYEKLSEVVGHSMFTCTPVNYFAKHGLIYGMIIVFGQFRFFKYSLNNKLEAIVLYIIFLISISSESIGGNALLFSMSMYGYLPINRIREQY